MRKRFGYKITSTILCAAILFSFLSPVSANRDSSDATIGSHKQDQTSTKDTTAEDPKQIPIPKHAPQAAGRFTTDQVLFIQDYFTLEMQQLAAYYYPELNALLTNHQALDKHNWNESHAIEIYANLNAQEQGWIDDFAPLVKRNYLEATNAVQQGSLESSVVGSVYGNESSIPDMNVTDDFIALDEPSENADETASVTGSTYGGRSTSRSAMMMLSTTGSTDKSATKSPIADYRYQENSDSVIDPIYRTSNQQITDLFLEGRNGLSFFLTRSYNSMNAKITTPGTQSFDVKDESGSAYTCTEYNIQTLYGGTDCMGNKPTVAWQQAGQNYVATGWELNLPEMTAEAYQEEIEWLEVPSQFLAEGQPFYLTDFYSRIRTEKPKLTFTLLDSSTYIFENGNPIPSNHPYANVTYQVTADNHYLLSVNNQLTYDFVIDPFTGTGKVQSITNFLGDSISFVYAGDKVTVTDTAQRTIEIIKQPIQSGSAAKRISQVVVKNQTGTVLRDIQYKSDFVSMTGSLRQTLGIKVVNNATTGLYDAVETYGSQETDISYTRLTSVFDAIGNRTLSSYTYYTPGSTTKADYNMEDDYAFHYTSATEPKLDEDQMESSDVVARDLQSYGEIQYLLLKDTSTDTGFTTSYDYRWYDPTWSQLSSYTARDAARGSIRMYLDNFGLLYTGYHSVTRVTFSYQNELQQNKVLSLDVSEDGPAKAQEIWKHPKDYFYRNFTYNNPGLSNYRVIDRLYHSTSFRQGDTSHTLLTMDMGDYTDRQGFVFQMNDINVPVKVKEYTAADSLTNGIDETVGTTRYRAVSGKSTTYTYDKDQTNPSAVYSYDSGAADDPRPLDLIHYLDNPLYQSMVPKGLNQFAVSSTMEYDSFGFITKQTDPLGNTTENTYSGPYHQIGTTLTTSADGLTTVQTSYTYNPNGTLAKTITETSYRNPEFPKYGQSDIVTTTYSNFNPFLQPQHIETSSEGSQYVGDPVQITDLVYSADGLHVIQKTISVTLGKWESPTQLVTNYAYDGLDRLKLQTNPDFSKVSYTYDFKDRVLSETFTPSAAKTNPAQTTQVSYDDANRTVSETSPDGMQTIIRYTPFGDIEKQEQAVGASRRTLVVNHTNSTGKLQTETLPYGDDTKKTQYYYGNNGQIIKSVNALNQETNYQYANAAYGTDGSSAYLQSVIRVTDPDGKETTTYQDKLGRIEKVVEQSPSRTRTTTYSYTPLGKTSEMSVMDQGTTQTTKYAYDGAGNLIFVEDDKGQQYQYMYNHLGKLSAKYINTELQSRNTYNEIGGLLSQTDAFGKQETYHYNNIGLLNRSVDRNGQTSYYTYTPYNELDKLSVNNSSGTEIDWTQMSYDSSTRLLNGITTKAGENLSYGYDQWNRQIRQTVVGRDYGFAYNDQDQLQAITYPDNQQATYTYDNLMRMATVTYPGMGTVSYRYTTAVDENKDETIYPGGLSQEESSNAFSELKTVKHFKNATQTWSENLNYANGFGNISSITRNGTTSTYAYDGLNRLINETLPTGTATYGYDELGNRQTLDSSSGLEIDSSKRLYTYDAFNRILTYNNSKGTTASYSYYGDGLRATKTVNGDLTRYVYLNGKNIEELDTAGNVKARNIWGKELLYRIDSSSGKKGYYWYNGHGDVVKITDSNGNVLNSYDYDTWGKLLSSSETMSNPFKYAGEIYDEETGFYYLRARYYSPDTGRFITEDTYEGDITDPLSLNLYVYCNNNPINRVDPSGNDSYVFYDPSNFSGQAASEAQRLANLYGTTSWLIAINNEAQFTSEWNKMGIIDGEKVSIDGVSLVFHGSPTEIMLDEGAKNQQEYITANPDGTTTKSGSSATYIGDLDSKTFKSLNLLMCNSGLVDYDGSDPVTQSGWAHDKYNKNLAITFLENNTITDGVNAWDGNLAYDVTNLFWVVTTFGSEAPKYAQRLSHSQKSFKEYRRTNRDPIGKVHYYKDSSGKIHYY
ncbi:RHS repeat domain-containing protein [Gorillibacterium massiliense]|uniref:RHS repeat domain-containing protein n=1 Tax=Gorillibacterium massiliense TaxID=1280390 RepID=UPI0004B026C4|nr:RHS repeat-associated core domain-containing protein [Gorillibacterium massiliense]